MKFGIGQRLILSFLLVAVLVGVVGTVEYITDRKTRDQVNTITEVEAPGLVKLSELKSHILVSIEGAFGYPLLGDQNEKEEFYSGIGLFDTTAAEFKVIARIGRVGQEEETELFERIVATKKSFEITAATSFASSAAKAS